MIKLSEKDKDSLISIFAASKYHLSVDDDINEYNYDNYIQYENDAIEKEDSGVSKAVFFPKDFPQLVVKIPFTAGPEEEYWFPNGSYYTGTTGSTHRHTEYDYEMRSSRFECAWESIPDCIDIELQDNWNYCEVEAILFKEAEKHGVGQFFVKTECIGYIGNYPIYAQEKCRIFDHRAERPLTAEEKERNHQDSDASEDILKMRAEVDAIIKEYYKSKDIIPSEYFPIKTP